MPKIMVFRNDLRRLKHLQNLQKEKKYYEFFFTKPDLINCIS